MICDDYAEIIVDSPTHGVYKAVIDLEDVERCNEIKWSVGKFGSPYDMYYLVARGLTFHRFIMDAPKGMDVDHIDGDTMNNRKENLRICTRQQNSMNRKMNIRNKSGYKGVIWDKRTSKWMAYIMVNYKFKNLGYHINIEDAVVARSIAEEKYFGEYKSIRED